MKKLLTLALGLSLASASAAPVTLTYWQYEYASKVSAMNDLIKKFEAANPDIKIKQETFPYDAYSQKVASSVPAGQGPDVVNLYYGWLPQYVDAGYLQPLPTKDFPTATIDSTYAPMVKTSKMNGKYYALPTAVRTLAIFYNKDLFKQAGIAQPPKTWEELIADGQKIVKGTPPRYTTLGFGIQPDGQDYHVLREVLVRQFGGQPYSKDGKTATYDSAAGAKAMTFYTDLQTKYKLGVPNFFPGNNSYRDAFIAGKVGMIIDGSFAINTIKDGAKFDWGVTTLPVLASNPNEKDNFGSYWVNGITKNAKGDKLDASVKFLKFLTSAETQRYWLENVGEIPASRSLAADPGLLKDPVYGPFIASLPYASSTVFVDEAGQRKAWVDAINTVLLKGAKPADAVKQAAADEQKILNSYYK
ncbi:extracellular solute-binding protein [Deinococcus marmoris]|uniref:Maltose/maltodextrin ABC transporter, substrate binding periplasmic protein MalE n=1 Tax=Deinococcus marmoris TaxID=249408 RepID=A0A1U7NRQ1_9DEIO|nr:extracellular solute-binding protein [Deinococcus marmoris]OLV15586.1 Maltose/maltodextrin ABC transporter, substrate binding periplasmic protein MalE [Deinococcus marmoris]